MVVLFSVILMAPIRAGEKSKIAVLLHDNNPPETVPLDRIEQVTDIAEILQFYGYQVYIITEREDLRPFKAHRIIVTYYGHGDIVDYPIIDLNGESYDFRDLMSFFKAKELIFLVSSCHSGIWISLGQEGRLIITNTNRTIAYPVPAAFAPSNHSGSLFNFFWFAHHRNLSFEEAYEVWVDELMRPWVEWQAIGCDDPLVSNCTLVPSPPQIYDGIEGDVWL